MPLALHCQGQCFIGIGKIPTSAHKRFKQADDDDVISNVAAAANTAAIGDGLIANQFAEPIFVVDEETPAAIVDEEIANVPADAIVADEVCPRCDTAFSSNDSLKVIGEICVKKKLPGGSPDWMASHIGGFTTASRVHCPSSRDVREMGEEEEVCSGGCTICCQAQICARDACEGGCSKCFKSRICENCKVLGCTRCVDEHSDPQGARLLGAASLALLESDHRSDAAACFALGRTLGYIGHCDECRDRQ